MEAAILAATDPKLLLMLPDLPRRRLLRQLDPITIIDLCLTSPTAFSIVSSFLKTPVDFKWVILAPSHFVIHITTRDQNHPKLIFRLEPPGPPIPNSKRYLSNWKEITVARTYKHFVVTCEPGILNRLEMFKELSETLMELLVVEKFHFKSNFFTDFFKSMTTKFVDFELSGPELTPENLKFLFQDIQVENFKLKNFSSSSSIPISVPITHKSIEFEDTQDISTDSFSKMSCEKMVVYSKWLSGISPAHRGIDLYDFVRIWAFGGFKELKELKMKLSHEDDVDYGRGWRVVCESFGLVLLEDSRVRRRDGVVAEMDIENLLFTFKLEY